MEHNVNIVYIVRIIHDAYIVYIAYIVHSAHIVHTAYTANIVPFTKQLQNSSHSEI